MASTKKTNFWRQAALGIAALLLITIALSLALDVWINLSENTTAKATQLSAVFAGVSALFSGLAFAGLIISLRSQTKQFDTQNKQFQEELKTQKDQFDKQFKTQQEQFDQQFKKASDQQAVNTIFQLINLHHEIVKNLEMTIKTQQELKIVEILSLGKATRHEKIQGKACLKLILTEINDEVKQISQGSTAPLTFEKIDEVYRRYHDAYHATLAHYLRHLYHVLRFINEESGLTPGEQQNYASILAAQLSADELGIMFYNAFLFEKAADIYKQYYIFQRIGIDPVLGNEEVIYCLNKMRSESFLKKYPEIDPASNIYQQLLDDLKSKLEAHFREEMKGTGIQVLEVSFPDNGLIYKDLIQSRFFSGLCLLKTHDGQVTKEEEKTFVFSIQNKWRRVPDLNANEMKEAIENKEAVIGRK